MADSKSSNPDDADVVELSDSSTMGSPTSPLSEPTFICPRVEQKTQEQWVLESTTFPCEQGLSNCECCEKRKSDNGWTLDVIDDCKDEMEEAIGKFRELYQATEYMKAWSKSKRPKIDDVLQKVSRMNDENEERLRKFMKEQQAAMAKLNEEKEERLQKFMMEQQVVMAKIIADAVKNSVTGGRLDSPVE